MDGNVYPPGLETRIREANWVVVSLLNQDPNRPGSTGFKRLLTEKSDLLANKKVIVFAFSAPYYLDATDISKITAYYGVFSKSSAYIDAAARVLFQELTPLGASPVSIPGIGYDLITAMSPDPAQVITLQLDLPESTSITPDAVETPTPVPPIFRMGDVIPLRTGVIRDHNQHQVPDGTVVRFIINTGGETGLTQQIEATTTAGIARAKYEIGKPGVVDIRAISDPAITSEIIRLEISPEGETSVRELTPTSVPSPTPIFPTEVSSPTPTSTVIPDANSDMSGFWDWLLSIFVIASGGILSYFSMVASAQQRMGMRRALCVILGGLIAQVVVILPSGSSGSPIVRSTGGLILTIILGMVVGLAASILWRVLEEKRQITH
jgi:beta-N-acetylhexosaminidase